jgi:hypothetical protein
MMTLALFGTIGLASAQVTTPGTTEQMSPGATMSQGEKLQLNAAQKSAILRAVNQEKNKAAAAPNLRVQVGAVLPESIELYALPDNVVAQVPATAAYRYTIVRNDVVLVDPTSMRVVDIIRQ